MSIELQNILPSELRIGNWVYDSECEPYYFKVEQLAKYVGSELWIIYRNGSIKVKEATPIPLTEEILLKCGFEKMKLRMSGVYYYELPINKQIMDNELRICHNKEYNYWDITHSGMARPTQALTYIAYLHQLQNIFFTLSSKELPIVLTQ